eukprot:TRINITY_DN166_c0_g1_i10.p1 TRINITY_DN166_c0_g1~~TRINITY_DN166_c0_g1_i10.p1  ORF type:complete len:127 (-),score=35.17 TRINITY_DN166_c0_g1_i10:91-471(-)
MLMKYREKFERQNLRWTTFVVPLFEGSIIEKFVDCIKNYNIKKIIFPKDRADVKNWIKQKYCINVVACFLHDLEVCNTSKDLEYMTSSGTLKRKVEMNKKTSKNKFWFSSKKKDVNHSFSLLSDFH